MLPVPHAPQSPLQHTARTWRANMDTVWGVSPSGMSLGFSCILTSCRAAGAVKGR